MSEYEQQIFDNIARAHPHEVFDAFPDQFWEFFQRECPGISREKMEQLLEETKE